MLETLSIPSEHSERTASILHVCTTNSVSFSLLLPLVSYLAAVSAVWKADILPSFSEDKQL